MSNGEVFQFEDQADLVGTEEVTSQQTIPRCIALVEVVENTLGASKARPEDGKRAKLMASCEFKIHQPAEYAGNVLRDQFVLASEDFPQRYDKGQFGARRWKTMLEKAQVQLGQSLQHAAMTSKGHMLMAKVDIELNEYLGKENWRNRIVGFFALGEREAQMVDSALPPLPHEGKQGGGGSAFTPPSAPVTPRPPAQFQPPVQVPAGNLSALPSQGQVFQPPQSPQGQPTFQPPQGLTVACMVCTPARQVQVSEYGAHMTWHGQNPGKQFPG